MSTGSYCYSASTGNLASKDGQALSYGDSNHPHAATELEGRGTYSYDANGNMASRVVGGVSYSLSYNAENRLVGMTGGGLSAAYRYDGDSRRVLAVVGARKTVYVGSYFEASYDASIPLPAYTSNSPQPLACEPDCYRHYLPGVMAPEGLGEPGKRWEYRSYYYAGAMRLSMRVQGGLRERGGEVYHLLGDHLGSTSVTVSQSGDKVAEARYMPWGEERTSWGAGQTDYGFTGQREDVAGLYFYQARWYDPALGRFLQADSLVPGVGNPQDWDRYAYTRNNPVRYTDPSGHTYPHGNEKAPLLLV